MWHHGQMFWGYGGWLHPMMIVFAIILIVFFFNRRGAYHHCAPEWVPGMKSRASALDILDRRYANGEIPQEEYFRVKKDLA